jgi:hypothetical protein
VTATDIHRTGCKSNEAAVGAATGIGDTPSITALTVLQNHPNPFHGRGRSSGGFAGKEKTFAWKYMMSQESVLCATLLCRSRRRLGHVAYLRARRPRHDTTEWRVLLPRPRRSRTVTKKMVIAR